MKNKNIPEKIKWHEEFVGWVYSILTVFAWIILILSSMFLIIYFFSFIFKWDIFNKDFIQLCVYLVIGTFLFIFVYDKHCKNKLKNPKK